MLPAAARRAAQRFTDSTGIRPTHTDGAKVAVKCQRTSESSPAGLGPEGDQAGDGAISRDWYLGHVAPMLSGVTLPAMARVTGAAHRPPRSGERGGPSPIKALAGAGRR